MKQNENKSEKENKNERQKESENQQETKTETKIQTEKIHENDHREISGKSIILETLKFSFFDELPSLQSECLITGIQPDSSFAFLFKPGYFGSYFKILL